MKKVLIVTPTSEYKDYCLNNWAKSISNLTYPADLLILDNTDDDGTHCHKVLGKKKFGKREIGLMYVPPIADDKDLRHTMCRCNNLGLDFALNNGYDYLMSIESDVFAPCNDAIEKLMSHEKLVCGFNYFISKWHFSTSIIENRFLLDNGLAVDYIGDDCLDGFYQMDGTLRKVPNLGLGFVLIDMKVFEKVPCFRVGDIEFETQKKDDKIHADTFFYKDLAMNGIETWCDTSLTCEHWNTNWLKVWKKESKLKETNKLLKNEDIFNVVKSTI